jgi:hypothetical protein
MANHLNIDFTELGNNSGKFWIHDPLIQVREFGTSTGMYSLGYLEKEKAISLSREYATFATGVPENEIRSDLIKESMSINTKLKQFQPDVLALVLQQTLDNSDPTKIRLVGGSKVPAPVFISVKMVGMTADGEQLNLYFRKVQLKPTDFELSWSGGEYASIPFTGQVLVDDDPETGNPDWAYSETLGLEDNKYFWEFVIPED